MTGLRTIVVKFVAFATLSGLLGLLLLNTMLNNLGGDQKEYTATFTEVSGLRAGDDIKVAGVRVGQVKKIEVDKRQAKVEFVISKDQPLLSNSKLVLRYQNLLGQRYLSIQQPAQRGEELKDGTHLGTDQTDAGFDLTVLLNGFRPLFRVLEPQDINRLATSLIALLQGEGGTIEQFLGETTKLTNFIADRDQIFDQVLTNLTPVLENLAGQGDELRGTVQELSALMTALAKDRAVLGQSIDGLSKLTGDLSSLFVDVKAPTEAALVRLRQVAAMFAANKDGIGATLEWFPQLFAALGRISQNSNQGNVYLCNLGLKLAGQTVFPFNGSYSEVCR